MEQSGLQPRHLPFIGSRNRVQVLNRRRPLTLKMIVIRRAIRPLKGVIGVKIDPAIRSDALLADSASVGNAA